MKSFLTNVMRVLIFAIVVLMAAMVILFVWAFFPLNQKELHQEQEYSEVFSYHSYLEEAEKYECSGSCFCDEDKERRTTATTKTLSTGVKYFIGAVSSVIAYQKAKSYFEKDCNEKFRDDNECRGEIRSSVDECGAVLKSIPGYNPKIGLKPSDYEIVAPERTEIEADDKGEARFQCYGKCRLLPFMNDKEIKKQFRFIKGRVKLKHIYRFHKILKDEGEKCFEKATEGVVMANTERGAAEKFLFGTLHPYCMETSMHQFERRDGTWLRTHLCAGYAIKELKAKGVDGPIENNRSIFCRRMVTFTNLE